MRMRMLRRPASLIALVVLSALVARSHVKTALALSPSSDSQLQGPATVGVASPINDASGAHLSVLVNAVQDPPGGVSGGPPGGGRWVVLDVLVTNTGTRPFVLTSGDFQLLSVTSTLYRPDGLSDLPMPQLAETLLNPGDTVEGNVIFAIPSGGQLQLVTFQAQGMSQWVVAALNPPSAFPS
jgi:hypothetical protein